MPATPAPCAFPAARAARRDLRRPRLVCLSDGSTVLVRLQTPDDRGQVAGLYARLSPHSRHMRFFTGMPERLPARLLDRLSDVDGERHVALLAFHRGQAVAAARYVVDRRDPAQADLAFAVADGFQRRGLARKLVEALREHAAQAGLERLTFDTLGENAGAQALLRSLGAETQAGGGLVSGVLPTGRAPAPALLAA